MVSLSNAQPHITKLSKDLATFKEYRLLVVHLYPHHGDTILIITVHSIGSARLSSELRVQRWTEVCLLMCQIQPTSINVESANLQSSNCSSSFAHKQSLLSRRLT